MRKILLFALLVCFFPARAQDIDVIHYKFTIDLNDNNDSIKGLAAITFIQRSTKPIVHFDLVSVNKQRRGMLAHLVSSDPSSSSHLSFSQTADQISINTPHIRKGDTNTIYIAYRGIPADGLIISKNRYGDRTFFADNWPNRAHHWIPCNDRPDDKAMFEFRVTAPAHYSVISNGFKNGEKLLAGNIKRTVWTENTALSTKVMVIGVARFATKTYEDSLSNIPVSAWAYPQDSAKWFYDYGLTPGILKFFADYIGPFPYRKLANVQSKTAFGGMENASAIFYNEDYVTGTRAYEDVMAHEIAHQWFGDMVSEKSFAHLWLSEGFADFFESLYIEKKYGEKAAREKWRAARDEVIAFARQSNKAVVDSTEDLMSLLNANSYKKGAWVLHMLRSEVGDSVFKKIIQAYYSQYKGSNAETRDFEAIAEKVSGKELTWFFDQWLYTATLPKLKFAKTKTQEGVKLTITQLQEPVFRLNLPVLLRQKKEQAVLKLTKRSESFLLDDDSDSAVIIDPYTTLLFEEIKK